MRKIQKCISLLHEEYTSLNYVIYFYDNEEKLQKERIYKPDMEPEYYDQIINGYIETAGIILIGKGKIKIFLFMFDDLEKNIEEVLELIGNLYHEIRHAWQYENKVFQGEEEFSTNDGNFESYIQLPSEKDAYLFQEEQLKRYWRKILEIFYYKVDKNIEIKYELKPEITKAINQ